jgi:hypothetical protein
VIRLATQTAPRLSVITIVLLLLLAAVLDGFRQLEVKVFPLYDLLYRVYEEEMSSFPLIRGIHISCRTIPHNTKYEVGIQCYPVVKTYLGSSRCGPKASGKSKSPSGPDRIFRERTYMCRQIRDSCFKAIHESPCVTMCVHPRRDISKPAAWTMVLCTV